VRSAAACLLAALAVTAAASAEARAPAVLVTFEQTGGFAGIERSFAVQRSGKLVSDGLATKTGRLGPAKLRALKDALARARFATLRRTYESEEQIDDGFVYRITYGGRTVRIEEQAKLPPRLERVYDLLSGLIHE
jgi:hypothetical protein